MKREEEDRGGENHREVFTATTVYMSSKASPEANQVLT